MPPMNQQKEESALQFVQSLRADGMSEADVHRHLKGAGYKTGRVNKLLAATRSSGSRDAMPRAVEAGSCPGLMRNCDNFCSLHETSLVLPSI